MGSKKNRVNKNLKRILVRDKYLTLQFNPNETFNLNR
ncbi:hypothetical protein SAMN05444412_102403 [Rhodonellum ikkaensis]|uniref:Ribosomal protein L32 n=1 Tax=Rhodonellum ikkaensis TaxID=336829 RepID=A0A1H3MAQ9_9BACT|nr:hypothetical protein SAMN05444412_102403 [Rhodonellum ikkaensis]